MLLSESSFVIDPDRWDSSKGCPRRDDESPHVDPAQAELGEARSNQHDDMVEASRGPVRILRRSLAAFAAFLDRRLLNNQP